LFILLIPQTNTTNDFIIVCDKKKTLNLYSGSDDYQILLDFTS